MVSQSLRDPMITPTSGASPRLGGCFIGFALRVVLVGVLRVLRAHTLESVSACAAASVMRGYAANAALPDHDDLPINHSLQANDPAIQTNELSGRDGRGQRR